ncbi:MAG: SET domain-containing protein, partial [Gemmatimonadaceae bacterium]
MAPPVGGNGAEPPFAIRRSRIQGRGAFATRRIKKGERLIEYLGERISWKEADRRYADAHMRRHHTFLFAVTRRTVIDAAVAGNDARFINHSCEPNCEAVDENGRIFIEALRA